MNIPAMTAIYTSQIHRASTMKHDSPRFNNEVQPLSFDDKIQKAIEEGNKFALALKQEKLAKEEETKQLIQKAQKELEYLVDESIKMIPMAQSKGMNYVNVTFLPDNPSERQVEVFKIMKDHFLWLFRNSKVARAKFNTISLNDEIVPCTLFLYFGDN